MCIAAFVWQSYPVYQFLLLLNRDEFHHRPTAAAQWWDVESSNSDDDNNCRILGGKDEVAGGTWLGCTKNGRLAFLTNVRDPDRDPSLRSRGYLPVRFLQSTKSPLEFAKDIAEEANLYGGFNLILIDICSKSMVYISNRPKGEQISIEEVPPGLHVISNAKLNSPWPKAQKLRKNLNEYLSSHEDEKIDAKEIIEELMLDSVKAGRDTLPDTGCSSDWEYDLSSIFIEVDPETGRYGTRSTTAVFVDTKDDVNFYERYLEDGKWKDHSVQFRIKKPH